MIVPDRLWAPLLWPPEPNYCIDLPARRRVNPPSSPRRATVMHSIRSVTDVLPVHPRLTHPLTGEPLRAVGVRADGRPIWPIMGGSQPAGEPPAGDPPTGTPPPPNPPTPPSGQEPPAQQGKTFDETYVKGLRDEAAKHRTEKQQTATERDTLKSTLDAIAKALDPKANEADPAKVAADLAASQVESKQAKLELAIYKAGGPLGADVAALLDSRGFLASVASIDPADSKAVKDAIEKAIKDNPKLKAGQAPPPRSGGDMPPAPGSGARSTSLTGALAKQLGGTGT